MEKYKWRRMFLRKGGKAIHQLGDLSRDVLDAELIYVESEDEKNYIGQYAEGFGFFGIKFAKEDCREATEEEVKAWIKDRDSVKF